MKRFFKSLIYGVVFWVRGLEKFEKIAHAIGAVIGIGMFIFLFAFIDKVPATASDYEPFEKQAIAAQENPELLFEKDCNININGEIITVIFANDECRLTAQYNQNFELLSISKENSENYMFGLWAFLLALLVGFCTYALSALIICVIMFLLIDLFKWIRAKRKSIKSNSKK